MMIGLAIALCICAWDARKIGDCELSGFQSSMGYLIAALLVATLARHGS